jgi:hypothetical protein
MTVDEVIRWEARSHERIYAEVRNEEQAPQLALAETLPMWRRIEADLGEIRSRYEAAHRRVQDVSSGADADAADAAAGRVTRALAEAQELAARAGARRAMLSELHGQLRRMMPQPRPPAERTNGFLLGGLAWLNAPDFDTHDATRRNDEEWARELMRRYEADVAVDQLGRSAVSDPTVADGDERTLPLGTAPAAASVGAWPDLDAVADPPTEPVAAVPQNGLGWSDFGPTGTDASQDAGGGHAMAGGLGRPPDSYLEEAAGPERSATANPFAVDIRLVPPVLGE